MRYTLLLIILLPAIQAYAQHSMGFSFEEDKPYVELCFKEESNLIIIPIMVNQEGPFNFILDTGSESGMIFDRFVIGEHNLVNARTIPIFTQNGTKITDLLVANDISIQMKGIRAADQSMLVLKENDIDIRNILGVEAHGVLGAELFNRFVVEVDYKAEKLRLYEPEHFKVPRGFRKVDVVVKNFRLYLAAQLKQKRRKKMDVNLLIDTGASSALFLDARRNKDIVLPRTTVEHTLGSSLAGDVKGKVGRIKKLSFGKRFRFRNVVTSFPEDWQVKKVVGKGENRIIRHGTIGSDILSRFTIIFDYFNSAIYLKKRRKYRERFRFNTAGFTFHSKGETFNQFYVAEVISGSPAERAGLQPGDELISIANKPAFFYSITQLNGLLRLPAGTKLSLIIRHNNQLIEKELTLKNLI